MLFKGFITGFFKQCGPLREKGRALLLFALCLFAGIFRFAPLEAQEFRQGRIRLTIYETTGRFSLYYLTDPETDRYEPLFTSQDPRTSFLAVSINERVYRLGEAPVFKIKIENKQTAPAVVFESPFLLIRQEFLFFKTPGFPEINGVRMMVHIENLGDTDAAVGLRFLIDTNLGEGFGEIPFETDKRHISVETGIDAKAEDMYWVSRNSRLSFMGSIFGGTEKKPDFIHFANWKRLNDMPWKISYNQGRNFNYPPYSMGDSAVCYYYEPVFLPSKGQLNYCIFLAGGTSTGFGFKPPPSSIQQREADIKLLRELLDYLDLYIAGKISMTAEELSGMEQTIARIKTRYNLP